METFCMRQDHIKNVQQKILLWLYERRLFEKKNNQLLEDKHCAVVLPIMVSLKFKATLDIGALIT